MTCGRHLVESGRGAVAEARRPAVDRRLAGSPVLQSVLRLRAHVPLIEPDVRISRIRLSDKTSCVRTRVAGRKRRQVHQAERLGQVSAPIACMPAARQSVLRAEPPAEPPRHVSLHGTVRLAGRKRGQEPLLDGARLFACVLPRHR